MFLVSGITGRTGKRVIEPSSMVSPDELGAKLGAVLGRHVTAQVLPREAWVPTSERMGFPDGQAWAFEGAEPAEGTMSARDVFAAAQNAAQA